MSENERPWTEDELLHFQMALDVLPYLSAMLQNDDNALSTLFEGEEKTTSEVATGLFSMCGILVDIICDVGNMNRMEVIRELSMFLNDQLI